jgi:hypothetical protein
VTDSSDHSKLFYPAQRERVAVMAIVGLVVLARSSVFILWEQAHFDSDQAVIGLMGKHLSEGRAFPLFLYGQNYIFAVEAWMAAAVFLVTGASVTALKLPLLAVNLAVAFLLLRLLERETGLRPALAAVAALCFVLPPPATAAMLLEANGVNVEPFLYVLLLWMTRRRPALFGVVFAVGFLQREFTAFALIALAIVEAATGGLFKRENIRRGLVAFRSAAEVWLIVLVAKQYASAAGPGTTIADVRAPANNVLEALTRVCFDTATVGDGVVRLVTMHWARLFGTYVEPLWHFGIESRGTQGLPGIWLILSAAMLLAVTRIVLAVAAERRLLREHMFCAYLTTVGLLTAAAFVIARCGAQGHLRYALLSIYAMVGLSAWYLAVERVRALRIGWIALVVVWASVSAFGHARLWAEYLSHPPVSAKQLIIRNLQARGIRYGIADYWIAYYTSFVTHEQIIVTPDEFPRIVEYDRQVDAHRSEAVRIARTPCAGGKEVTPGIYFCAP